MIKYYDVHDIENEYKTVNGRPYFDRSKRKTRAHFAKWTYYVKRFQKKKKTKRFIVTRERRYCAIGTHFTLHTRNNNNNDNPTAYARARFLNHISRVPAALVYTKLLIERVFSVTINIDEMKKIEQPVLKVSL